MLYFSGASSWVSRSGWTNQVNHVDLHAECLCTNKHVIKILRVHLDVPKIAKSQFLNGWLSFLLLDNGDQTTLGGIQLSFLPKIIILVPCYWVREYCKKKIFDLLWFQSPHCLICTLELIAVSSVKLLKVIVIWNLVISLFIPKKKDENTNNLLRLMNIYKAIEN